MNNATVKTGNSNVKPNMVNIELPRQVADNLKTLIKSDYDCNLLELLTDDNVFDILHRFFDEPEHQKKTFDKMLFNHLSGLSKADDNSIEYDEVFLLRQVSDLLSCSLYFIDTRTMKGGAHV